MTTSEPPQEPQEEPRSAEPDAPAAQEQPVAAPPPRRRPRQERLEPPFLPPELMTERQREQRRLRSRGNLSLKLIALAAFVFGVALHGWVALSFLEDDESDAATVDAVPTEVIDDEDPTPEATAEIQPTPTQLPDRTNCEEIRGTQYRSVTEREFFLANCIIQPSPAPTTNATEAPGPSGTQTPN